ncbi:hypothetical protein [Alkanindiges illinoisensis]|uniref:hypothetical protein n=1 Tax=Alkanindiges illinoisensis TaxID=197183 RepID=UPI000479400E|nr:hypothetical protein [Alkanindiges illinoisensis]
MNIDYESISQSAFDKLHLWLNAVASEESYHRWVKDGRIRIVDIWDVFTKVPFMYVFDWKDTIEDCIAEIQAEMPTFAILNDIDLKNLSFNDLEGILSNYNQKQNEQSVLIFGKSWHDSDGVMLIIVNTEIAEKIVNNDELASLFTII